jgi:hypothetical protein
VAISSDLSPAVYILWMAGACATISSAGNPAT